MDIMGPPLEQQAGPAPWLVARQNVDVPAMVERILQDNPEASASEVIDTLARMNVQANGVLVAQQVLDFRRKRPAGFEAPATSATPRTAERRAASPVGAA